MDEHGEINLLLFNGLTAHDADDNIVPVWQKNGEYDAENLHLHLSYPGRHPGTDGEKFTADDVKLPLKLTHGPENGSENAPNYEDVEEITVR